MKSICALYEEETELQESHIFPKFVVSHTKKTGSNYLRNFIEPNRRLQDGIKLHLLGFKAEQDFSLREKWFAENIFQPYLNGEQELAYDENLYYFAVSFIWRVLQLQFKKGQNIEGKWYYNKIVEAEREWKAYLTKGEIPKKFKNINLLFTDRVAHSTLDVRSVDNFFTRILDATIVTNDTRRYLSVYGKFNRFIFWATLSDIEKEDELKHLEINPKGGKFIIPQSFTYIKMSDFFLNRIKQIDSLPLPSEEQQNKIEKEIWKDLDRFKNSDAGQSILNDLDLRENSKS